GNYNGTPSKYVTPLAGIKSKVSADTTVLYAPGTYKIGTTSMPIPGSAFSPDGKGSGSGLKGEYFNNRELKGTPVLTRNDGQVNFDWGAFSPAPELTPQDFSTRWTGKLTPPVSGKYSLGFAGNGWIRIYVDGQLLVE